MKNESSFDILTQESNPVQTVAPTKEDNTIFKVQEIRQQQHRRTATGKSNMFSGLVFCNDCKQKLYYSTTSYFEKRQDFFICSTHRVNKDKCSGHYVRAVVLEKEVWKHIQEVISVVTRHEDYFRSEMGQVLRVQSEETLGIHKKRLAQAEKRIGKLDRLFIRIYEDNVSGRLDDEKFAMMSANYTQEQKGLKAEAKSLQQVIQKQEQQAENLEQFIQRAHRNSQLTELTPYALRELVKAVYVGARISPAARGNRSCISPTTSLAISPWMYC